MPLTRRQIYRRRRITVFSTVALVLGVGVYTPGTLLAPLPTTNAVTSASVTTPAAPTVVPPRSYASYAIGAVGFDGVLAGDKDTTPLPTASIAKIVTALVVLQAKPLAVGQNGPSVTITAKDASYYSQYLAENGKVVAEKVGTTFTQLELLKITLIESANNYAETLAVWAYGSENAYLTAAKAWLTANGLTHTTVVDTSGIDDKTVSTATDLIALGKIALANPVLKAVVDTPQTQLHDVGVLQNTNDMLGQDSIDGIKTGTLDSFGSNLLFSASYTVGGHPVRVIGVILGATDHGTLNSELRTLLHQVKASFHSVTLARPGQPFGTYTTVWGSTARAVAQRGASVLVWGSTASTAHVITRAISTDAKHASVGSVTFTTSSHVTVVPLVLDRQVADPGAGWRFTHPGELF